MAFEQEKERFFIEIHHTHPGSNADFIMAKISEKSPGTLQVHALYQQDTKALRTVLSASLNAVNKLPLQQPKRLALFAADVTDNPHFFDVKTDAGRLFISFFYNYCSKGMVGYTELILMQKKSRRSLAHTGYGEMMCLTLFLASVFVDSKIMKIHLRCLRAQLKKRRYVIYLYVMYFV